MTAGNNCYCRHWLAFLVIPIFMQVFMPFLCPVQAKSIPSRISGTTAAMMYLSRFGYMDPSISNPRSGALISADTVRQAIIEFQSFAGLNMTGELDAATIEMMNMPRCGVKDKVGFGSSARRKRYALQGSRWKVRDLTYWIDTYPRGLLKSEVDREIDKALQVWGNAVDGLTFRSVSRPPAHIEISFEDGEHGDGDPFDGPGGTLAHAYFPIFGGDAHFDVTEAWTIDNYKGTNLFQVAAHEFGHSLGLSHSDVETALMAPFYRGYNPSFALDYDDVTAIRLLYSHHGVGKTTTTTTTTTTIRPTTHPSSELCQHTAIDSIVTMVNQKTYVFKGSKYWQLTDEGIANGYPKYISDDYVGLPDKIDAAFTWTNGRTYFFKGHRYWRTTDMKLDPEYPKNITKGFVGIPNHVDAAFVWSGNGKIYFFKGSKYWRFDPTKRPPVAIGYPKSISKWKNLPSNIDDALQYSNGYTYFFKKGEYYRFNDRAFRVDDGNPGPSYPRNAASWWFGCSTNSKQSHYDSQRDSLSMQGAKDVSGDFLDAENDRTPGTFKGNH